MYFCANDIEQRRQKLQKKLDVLLSQSEAVIVYSGYPIQKPGGLDQCYPFLPLPSYFWLTGRRRETEVILYSRNDGWVEFQKHYGVNESVWEGEKNDILVDKTSAVVQTIDTLEAYLQKKNYSRIYKISQVDPIHEGTHRDIKTAMDQIRRCKDEAEVKLIRHLAGIAKSGYHKIEQAIKPGLTEKQLQLIYENEIYSLGAHTVPYESIVGSGKNAAILHALPTQKQLASNEFVLIDAGVDIYDYCVDITRMFSTSKNAISTQHKDLYNLVHRIQQMCIQALRPGVWWRDVHTSAAEMLTQGLLDLGILQGSYGELIEKEVASAFFPHGLGHLVGLKVRDTGHEENLHPKTYFGARLRVDIQLEENHLITVEPGCYFIPSLLYSENIQSKYKSLINWTVVEKWLSIGGVRIEDDILITANGSDNLTAVVSKSTDFN